MRKMLTLTALVIAALHVAHAGPSQADGVSGFVLTGTVEYQRKGELAEFTLKAAGQPAALVRLSFNSAFPGVGNKQTIAAKWAKVFLTQPSVSIRVSLKNGAIASPPEMPDTVALCSAKPTLRESDLSGYALSCLALSEQDRAIKDGQTLAQIIIGTAVPTGSTADAILKRGSLSEPFLVAWLE